MNNQATVSSESATPASSVNVWKRPLPPQVTQPKRKVSGSHVPVRPTRTAAPKRKPSVPPVTVKDEFPMLGLGKVQHNSNPAIISGVWNRPVKPVPPSLRPLVPVTSAFTTSECALLTPDSKPTSRRDLPDTPSADMTHTAPKALRKTAGVNSLGVHPTRRTPVSAPATCAPTRKTSATNRLSIASARNSINARRISTNNRKTSTTMLNVAASTTNCEPIHADAEERTADGSHNVATCLVANSSTTPAKMPTQRHDRCKTVLVADIFMAIESFAKRSLQPPQPTDAILPRQELVEGAVPPTCLPPDEPVSDVRDTPHLAFDVGISAELSNDETPSTTVDKCHSSHVRVVRSRAMKAVIGPAVHHRRRSLDNALSASAQLSDSQLSDDEFDIEPLVLGTAENNLVVNVRGLTSLPCLTPPPAAPVIPQLDKFAFRRLSRRRPASAHSLLRHLGQKAYLKALRAASPAIDLVASGSPRPRPSTTAVLSPSNYPTGLPRSDQVNHTERSDSAKLDAVTTVGLPVAHPPAQLDLDPDELDVSGGDDENRTNRASCNVGLPIATPPAHYNTFTSHHEGSGTSKPIHLDISPKMSPVVGLPIATSPVQLQTPLYGSLPVLAGTERQDPLYPEPEVDFDGWESRWEFEEPAVTQEMSRMESSLEPSEEATRILIWRQDIEQLQAAEWAAEEHELGRPSVAAGSIPRESVPALGHDLDPHTMLTIPLSTLPIDSATQVRGVGFCHLQRALTRPQLELHDAEAWLQDPSPLLLQRAPAQLLSAQVKSDFLVLSHLEVQRVPAALHPLDSVSNHHTSTPPLAANWGSCQQSTPDSLPPIYALLAAHSVISSLPMHDNSSWPSSTNRYLAALPEFDAPPPADADTSGGRFSVDVSLDRAPAYMLPSSFEANLDSQLDESSFTARSAIKSSTAFINSQPPTFTRSSDSQLSGSSASSVLSLSSQDGAEICVAHAAEGLKQDRLGAISKVSLWLQNERQHYRYTQDANMECNEREKVKKLGNGVNAHCWNIGSGGLGLTDGGVLGGW